MPSFSDFYAQIFPLLRYDGRVRIPLCSSDHLTYQHYHQVASYEWCFNDRYDDFDREHASLAELLSTSACLAERPPGGRTVASAIHELQQSGFDLIYSEDLAERKSRALSWYYPLEVALSSGALPFDAGWDGTLLGITTRNYAPYAGLNVSGASALIEAGKHKV